MRCEGRSKHWSSQLMQECSFAAARMDPRSCRYGRSLRAFSREATSFL